MDMAAFFRDNGTSFVAAIALLNAAIINAISFVFKDNARWRNTLLGVSFVLTIIAIVVTCLFQSSKRICH